MPNRPIWTFDLGKYAKISKKRKWPSWPWLWPCDLEINRVCWPCLYLPTIWIWWPSKVIKAVSGQKTAKNGNDLRDLDFDLVTLRSTGYVDLVYTYLWYEYSDHQRSLRLSKANFEVWPWTSIIWPWGQKFKIPLPTFFAYGHREHIYAFLALSYQNCRRR